MKECFWLKIEARIELNMAKNPHNHLTCTIIGLYWTYMPEDWIFSEIWHEMATTNFTGGFSALVVKIAPGTQSISISI